VLRRFRPIGALTTVVVGSVLLLSLGLAVPAAAVDYPSWDDVLAAQGSQAATTAKIAEIEGILIRLDGEATELGRVAQVKAEEYNSARDAAAAAAARSAKLREQVQAADKRAKESAGRAGQLIAQFARTGGGSLSLGLVVSNDAGNLLDGLGAVSKLTERSTLIYRQAIADKNLAQSLTDQARLAQKKRKALATTAQAALDLAQKASDDAIARLNEQQAIASRLYAQLASLKGTTASVESGYAAGLTKAAEEAAQPPPPPPAPVPPNPPPPPPSSSAVDGAVAFAYAQIGDAYAFAGSGPDAWDCSGLTKAAYASVGVYIGAHVVSSQYYTMANAGRLVPLASMVAGDLIFYANGGTPSGGFYHVALYVGNGRMIEAPRAGVPVRITAVRYYDVLAYAGRPTP
jgi:cell wall-associated NlpC family hydrolase